jgi:hypothetical protein
METARPFRRKASAVRRTFTEASASRTATASVPNPLKTGTQMAPIFEHAITAATVSGSIGRKIPTASRASTPKRRSARPSRSVSRRRWA